MSKLTKDVIKQLIAENLNEATFVTPSGKKVKKTDSGYENVEGKTSAEERKRYERLAQLKKLKAEKEEPVKENRVTKSYLNQVIKEEYQNLMSEIRYRGAYDTSGEYTGDPSFAPGPYDVVPEQPSKYDWRLQVLASRLTNLDEKDPQVKEFTRRVNVLILKGSENLTPEQKQEIDKMYSMIVKK